MRTRPRLSCVEIDILERGWRCHRRSRSKMSTSTHRGRSRRRRERANGPRRPLPRTERDRDPRRRTRAAAPRRPPCAAVRATTAPARRAVPRRGRRHGSARRTGPGGSRPQPGPAPRHRSRAGRGGTRRFWARPSRPPRPPRSPARRPTPPLSRGTLRFAPGRSCARGGACWRHGGVVRESPPGGPHAPARRSGRWPDPARPLWVGVRAGAPRPRRRRLQCSQYRRSPCRHTRYPHRRGPDRPRGPAANPRGRRR